MSLNPNPFIRGYRNLRIERTLVLTTEGNSDLVHVPLHESQQDLPSHELRARPCLFNGDFGLVITGKALPIQLRALCRERGYIRDVVYAIVSNEDGIIHHIGDSPARNMANEVVKRLTFETGYFSRCWEISMAHLTEDAAVYLEELADIATPTDFLFVAFRLPYSPAIGVKLISTPWWGEHLQRIEGMAAGELRQVQLDKGMPECLVDTLHLAAQADVRILIFDGDAPALDGLPKYEWE